MGCITRLSPQEAIKIAAGEVVERPSNIVKELLENAIDAGATNIRIAVSDGGKSSISVIDNGCGMDSEDARACFEHHATSKLKTVAELEHIATFGFRGEALSSVAAVSHVVLHTKQEDQSVGTRVIMHHGEHVLTQSAACPTGTTITITELFDTIPARKKFLKKKETELRHIQQLVLAYALANKNTAFRLEHNGTRLLQVHAAQSLLERTQQLSQQFGSARCLELTSTTLSDGTTISGIISDHQTYRYDRSLLFLFINGRWIKNFPLTNACIRGYANVLPQGRYPAAAIFIQIDPTYVDVNVHPRKEEVQLMHPQRICTGITEHIKTTLESNVKLLINPSEAPDYSQTNHTPPPITPQPFLNRTKQYNTTSASAYENIPQFYTTPPVSHHPLKAVQDQAERPPSPTTPIAETKNAIPNPASYTQKTVAPTYAATILGQLFNTYIVIEQKQSLILIDQHAAHERILYEKLAKNFASTASIKLLFPEIINLEPMAVTTLEPLLPTIQACGLEIALSGATSFVVHAKPAHTERLNVKDLLLELCAQIKKYTEHSKDTLDKTIQWHVHSHMACKAAIKAGDILDRAQMEAIIEQLFASPNYLTCPHGRPTTWSTRKDEIERMFKRKK